MIMWATGHRPQKLGGYDIYFSHVLDRLVELAKAALRHYKPKKMYVGGAQGWDTAVALACTWVDIPFVVAVPCRNHESKWPQEAKELYWKLLDEAYEVKLVTDKPYEPRLMQVRNVYMVDNGHEGLALHDGSKGGTQNCINYADVRGKVTHNLWSSWIKYGGVRC